MGKLWIFSIIIFICGCATTRITPEQIREFQTRTYDTNDTKMIMKAMINVLQDDGFIIKNAVMDLGLLYAEKAVDVESKVEAFLALLSAFFLKGQARWKKVSLIECTVNVSEYDNQTRVRVNFQVKVLDNRGSIMEVKQVEEKKYYQNFFSKVDKAIFTMLNT